MWPGEWRVRAQTLRAAKQNIRRFDIAVDQTMSVGIVESGSHIARDGHDFIPWHKLALRAQVLMRLC